VRRLCPDCFSADRMAADYEAVFESMQRRSQPVLISEEVSPRQSLLIG
jgi:hypothetical protein